MDDSVIVFRGEAVEEGTAEALDGRGGACKPVFRDTEDFAIAALGWRWCREWERMERWEE